MLLHHGDDLVLIDGGPAGSYDTTLAPRLAQLTAERGQPPRFRLIAVGHNEGAHVSGLADMLADARRSEDAGQERPWDVEELWFNAFDRLTGSDRDDEAQRAAMQALFAATPADLGSALAVDLATATTLREAASALRIGVNTSLPMGMAMRRDDVTPSVEIAPGLTFSVLAPSANDVLDLRAKWSSWELAGAQGAAAEEVVWSMSGAASMVLLARTERHSVLLTGDAGYSQILEGLASVGMDEPLTVDVLKVPAHGKAWNLGHTFYRSVRARHYIISANGENGMPETDTLAAICDASDPCTLWLTYGGEPGDGAPGLHDRLRRFFDTRRYVDVRIAPPGRSLVIALS
jgi:hypothetical protein